MNSKAFFLLLGLLLLNVVAEKHQTLQLDKPYQRQLTAQTFFTGKYTFQIPQSAVRQMKGDKWFFFVQVEPNEENEWVSTSIEISIGKKDSEESRNTRTCGNRKGGVDSCFFTNKQFDYKTQDIHAKIRCKGVCKIKVSGEISQPYKLQPGQSIQMDFQNTAYSKVFILDTTKTEKFDQLRITLRPKGFLNFPAPIGLYVNKGTLLPTRKQNDFESLTLWDNGEGVFIDAPDAQNLFTILVQSPEKNLLVLSTQTIVFKKSVDIPETLPYFDYLGEGSSRLYRAKVNPSKGINIKLATFSGSIRLKEIYDNNNEAISDQFPQIYRSFSQMEYQIPAEFFNDNKNRYQIGEYIIFKIEAIKQSTYLVEAYQINKGIVHLVPELNRYVDLASRSSNQYYIDVVEPVRPEFKKSQIEVVVMHGQSKPLKTRFFKCKKDHGRECEVQRSLLKERSVNTDSFMQITATIQDHLDNGIVVYKFFLPNKVFEKVNNNSDVKHYIMTVVVQNQYNASQVYTIRYTDPGRNIYLKEQESHKDRISIDEVKHYVFTNRHADVQQVRVHLVEIAGRVHIEGFKSDPRKSNLQGQQIIDFHNTLKYTNVKLNDTLFVRITGKEAAFYSLQVQLIKESEREWWRHNKTQVNKTKGYNQVVIFEDIPYEFNLQPNQKAVYQIHTKKSEFVLEMTSLLPLELCMTQELTKPPFQPNCQENDKLIKKEVLQVRMERGKIANIGVTNNNTKSNKFSIKFSSFKQGQKPNIPVQDNKDNYTVAKCLPALLGKTTKYNIEKLTQTCYTYFIAKAQNLELMIDIVSREYDKVNILAVLGQERITITSSQHIFKKEQVQKACKKLFPCTMKVFIQSQVKTQLRFSVQYLDGTIFLLDGIANTFSGSNNKRYFAYELYNKVNTTIILQNKNGFYKFYGNIVEASQYWKSKESQKDLFPTNTKNNLKSTNPFYYSYQIAIVSEKQIKEANCNQCLLLLTIQKDKDSINDAGYFTIQCTQQDSFLKPNSPVATFLGKNSFAFYEIYNQKEGTLVVSLNSQNQECARIYAKKGATRASGNENDGTTSQNTLIIKNAEKGNYAVTVEATEDCYYSIEYSNSQSKIYSTIEQGYLIDIRLEKSQSQKLLYHHTKKQSFRILTLHQAGQVSLNVRTYKDIKSFINDNSTKVRNVWSGKDFLRIENDSYKFCVDCYYLIQLVAQRQTKTSVIIPVEGSQFPIMMDSMIKQELKANQYETIRVFTQKIVQFEINVQYGRVNVSLQAKDKTQYLFTKVYTASQATQYENISTSQSNSSRPDRSYYFAQFSRIIIRAEENSGFSFGLISDIDESKRGSKVKYGIPEYLSLQKDKYECLYGRIDSAEQQFLISITGDQSQSLMNNLQVSCTSTYKDKKQLLELEKDVAKNQMIVKIDRAPKNLPTQYEFCMKSKENVFLTFIQSASLVYLPQSTTTVVQKSMNFSFYSQGKNVLQINECKSRAVTTILNSFSTTDKVNSEIKQIRKSNNIIEFLFYGPVYININTTSSTIAWRRKDQQKRLGYGYDEYSPNKLRYSLVDGTLKVVIYGLKKNGNIAKPMVDFGQSNYTAFLAEEQMNLYDAINCAKGTYLQQSYKSSQPQNQVTVNFDIKQILEKFKDRKYLLVGALVVATSKIEGDGKYRFLYPYQQIPMSALTGGKIQEKSVSPNPTPSEQKSDIKHEQPWEILLYIILGLLIIAGAVYIYRKYLRRFLRKRRLQKLSEQGTGEVKYQQYSSYTNQR